MITVASRMLVLYIKMYFFQCFVSLIDVSNRISRCLSLRIIHRIILDLHLSFPLITFPFIKVYESAYRIFRTTEMK
jgi:hypothetical protein